MEDARQIGQDLQFVRNAVTRNERNNRGAPVLAYLWAAYVLIGYALLVGLVPHYGWTSLGAVIALGLIAPTFFHSHRADAHQPQAA